MTFDMAPSTWQLWTLAVPALGLLMAIEWDVRERRIPNLLVLLLLLAGVLLHGVGPANGGAGVFAGFPGALGVTSALLGALTGLVLFLPLYLSRAMGAGDVKLMAAMGTYVGPLECVGLALSVLVAGGLLALARMLIKRNGSMVLANVGVILRERVAAGGSRFDPARDSADRMPYALAFAAGSAGYAYWRLMGGGSFLG